MPLLERGQGGEQSAAVAQASVAAGPLGRDASASTDIQMRAQILSYSRSRGLFAGVTEGICAPINEVEGYNKGFRDVGHPEER